MRFLEPPPSVTSSLFSPRNDLACLVLESAWSSIESILSPSTRATGIVNVKNQAEREDEESVKMPLFSPINEQEDDEATDITKKKRQVVNDEEETHDVTE